MTLIATRPIEATAPVLAPSTSHRISETSEDRALWEALLDQREEALSEAYRRFGQKVYRTAFGVLRRSELAEDVVQEVFVRIWQRPDRFEPSRGSLGGFLQLDAHGRSVDLLRSERARADREIREQQLSASSNSPMSLEEEVMKRISSERIRDALETLDADERLPIALAFFQGHSYRRVAEALDLPEGTVKSRIRRGMSRLKELLGEEALALV
ncbi:MAG: sigma-70 family RNA polymerase sigma factor [Acidimicrobiia bacterium]